MKGSPASNRLHTVLQEIIHREFLTVTVQGNCMQPLLDDGARVQVRRKKFYLPGDVVVILSPSGRYLVHRFLGCYPGQGTVRFVTRADNGLRPDGAVAAGAVLGRVTGGQCRPQAFRVPLGTRIRALGHFTALVVERWKQRVGVRQENRGQG